MTAFEILLASAIVIAATLQVVVLYLLYRVVSRAANRAESILSKLEPEVENLATTVRSVRLAVEASSEEFRGTLTGLRTVIDGFGGRLHECGQDLTRVAWKATVAAERQIDATEQALDLARERVVQIGRELDRGVLDPIRSVLAVTAGVRKAIAILSALRSQPAAAEDNPPPDSSARDAGSA